ncbi:MAG: FecR family protein [Elusimicrobiales bacterium]|nr:FecR family protein [Elusimicrobiales bacterium]
MRIKILYTFLFMLLPGLALAGESKILSMSGTVEARQTREGQWVPASENMEIAEGGAVRTGADGGAVILMPNKTKVWLKDTTSLELEQRQTLASRLALVFGKIKVRVPHLMRKEKFEVRTPAAVCAVRGTEFTMGTTEDGKMELQVLFGEVKLKFIVPPEKGRAEFNIPQGQGLSLEEKGQPAKPALLTKAVEREALENWNPGLKPEERGRELRQKENDRAQVKEFARVSNNTDAAVKGFVNVVKESDLEAGRTLNDVHGNLVRVDQRMMRPAADEIQFFNLVKRPTYANYTSAADGFAYNGGAVTNRLDYMQMTMNFNKDLPQRIEEWPAFFNGNSVNAEWASFVLANRTKADEIFFIGQGYEYDAARDELVNNTNVVNYGTLVDRNVIITGVIKDEVGVSAIAGLGRITNLDIQDAGTLNGQLKYGDGTNVNGGLGTDVVWAVITDDAVSYSKPTDRPDNAPLVQYQADMYDVGAQGTGFLWFAKENYVIGNGGQIRTPGDFTNSSSDPFSLLKDNALETVMYVKKSVGNNSALITNSDLAKADIDTEDWFSYNGGAAGVGTNIDIVFIPDLMVAAVQRMLPAITNLKD